MTTDRPTTDLPEAILARRKPSDGQVRIPEPAVPKADLRIGVHDRSRLEWVATVPIAPPGEQHTWNITLQAEIPDAMWLDHQPWQHFTVRSRLTSPALALGRRQLGPDIDQLRRKTMAAVHDLKGATAELSRALRKLRRAEVPMTIEQAREHAAHLWQSVLDAWTARERFAPKGERDSEALLREHRLADEFLSNQILMLVTEVARTLGPARLDGKKRIVRVVGETEPLEAALSEVLAAETQWRKNAGVRWAAVSEPHAIEGFIQRAAQLKKHFQQALFLDARAYMLDLRLRNWIAIGMAMIASTFYFVWQIWVLNSAMTTATTTNSLLIAGLIAGVIYAGKDRIKEVGREWVAQRVRLTYGDRIANLYLQERMDPKHSHFALARETILVDRRYQADPLNPALGATQVTHHLEISEKLRHTGLPILREQGLLGLKHVFRYDLSPLLVKLDDQKKRVPVHEGGLVRNRSVTRVYMIAIRVWMQRTGSDEVFEHRGILRLRRTGLERFVEVHDAATRPRRQRAVAPVVEPREPTTWPNSAEPSVDPALAQT